MILNLTQHPATADQLDAGVVDLVGDNLESLKTALTFNSIPTESEVLDRAETIALLANAVSEEDDFDASAMIGGALWLMAPLADALRNQRIIPLFAFSVRDTEEQKQADGSIRKVTVFRHTGFFPAIA